MKTSQLINDECNTHLDKIVLSWRLLECVKGALRSTHLDRIVLSHRLLECVQCALRITHLVRIVLPILGQARVDHPGASWQLVQLHALACLEQEPLALTSKECICMVGKNISRTSAQR